MQSLCDLEVKISEEVEILDFCGQVEVPDLDLELGGENYVGMIDPNAIGPLGNGNLVLGLVGQAASQKFETSDQRESSDLKIWTPSRPAEIRSGLAMAKALVWPYQTVRASPYFRLYREIPPGPARIKVALGVRKRVSKLPTAKCGVAGSLQPR